MAKKKKRPRPPARRGAEAATGGPGGGANLDRRGRKDEARRARESERKRIARRAAFRRALIFAGIGVLVVVALTYFRRAGSAKPLSPAAQSAASAAGCSEVETPAASAPGGQHDPPYSYSEHPATSGPHDPSPLPGQPRVYTTPVQEPQAVHSLEHGSVIMYYRLPTEDGLSQDVVNALGPVATGNHATYLIPYAELPQGTGLAITAWNKIVTCPASITVDQATTLAQGFIDSFACTSNAPEGKLGDGC
jgi:Protein of unknown function (DUF3105)